MIYGSDNVTYSPVAKSTVSHSPCKNTGIIMHTACEINSSHFTLEREKGERGKQYGEENYSFLYLMCLSHVPAEPADIECCSFLPGLPPSLYPPHLLRLTPPHHPHSLPLQTPHHQLHQVLQSHSHTQETYFLCRIYFAEKKYRLAKKIVWAGYCTVDLSQTTKIFGGCVLFLQIVSHHTVPVVARHLSW